jgi:hypothetical protein
MQEIEKIIKTLKPANLHGCDEISVTILKISSQFISSSLRYVINHYGLKSFLFVLNIQK